MKRSQKLFQRAQLVIPAGVNSPVRAFRSGGPLIVGHAHPDVVNAAQQAAERGLSFGAPTEQEVEMAELLCRLVPSLEQGRVTSSGTEGTMSAIRLARGHT